MSYPTSPYLLYDNQQTVNREPFNNLALHTRFGEYAPTAKIDCSFTPINASNPATVVSAPCAPELSEQDMLGIGHNNGILEYQFGSSMNVPFCGVPLSAHCSDPCAYGLPVSTDCKKCPCSNAAGGQEACNYGFARSPGSAFGPSGGNRYGNLKWGG